MKNRETDSLGLDGETIYIDPTVNGNVARFINTSHNPNCVLETCIIEGKWIPCYVVTKKISKGGEVLANNYGPELYKDLNSTPAECHCGSRDCSGFIGVSADQLPTFSKTLFQMLKEEKEKSRDVEEDRQLYVLARKNLDCMDSHIQDTEFWSKLSTKLDIFNIVEEKEANVIDEVIQKLDNVMKDFCDFCNAQLPEIQQVPEDEQNVEMGEIEENVQQDIQEETPDDNEKILLDLYDKLVNGERNKGGRGKTRTPIVCPVIIGGEICGTEIARNQNYWEHLARVHISLIQSATLKDKWLNTQYKKDLFAKICGRIRK